METRTVTRLYVGEAPQNEIAEYLDRSGIQGATIYPATGIWKGGQERSNVVEIVGLSEDEGRKLQEDLAEEFEQDSVMFLHTEAGVKF